MVVGEAAGGGNEMSLSNMVLGFYEEAEREMRWPEDASATAGDGSDDDDEGSSPRGGRAESAEFWREQRSLLHVSSFPFPVPIDGSCICAHHAPRIV